MLDGRAASSQTRQKLGKRSVPAPHEFYGRAANLVVWLPVRSACGAGTSVFPLEAGRGRCLYQHEFVKLQ